MVRFNKYWLLVFTAITIPASLAQTKHSATPKTGLRDRQPKDVTAPKSELLEQSGKTFLHKDWEVQSSCDDQASGDKIS